MAEVRHASGKRGWTWAAGRLSVGASPPWQSVQPRCSVSFPCGSWTFWWQHRQPALSAAAWSSVCWSRFTSSGAAASGARDEPPVGGQGGPDVAGHEGDGQQHARRSAPPSGESTGTTRIGSWDFRPPCPFVLVPTLCVGTPGATLCVASRAAGRDAERPDVGSHAERGNQDEYRISGGGEPQPAGRSERQGNLRKEAVQRIHPAVETIVEIAETLARNQR